MADSNIVPVTSGNAPRYRYYTVDIVSNTVIGEIPFEDVSYARSLKAPGSFEGKITISSQTKDLDLYNATLPGRTAIYVVRDNKAVWGGIIWGRTYDLVGRSLAVTASEFTSYLSKRFIWKPYSSSFTADLFKPTKDGAVLVAVRNQIMKEPIRLTDEFGNKTKVEVTFVPATLRKYNGFYEVVGVSSTPVSAPEDPKNTTFHVNIPKLPVPTEGIYNNVGVTVRVDTYDYLKDLLSNVFDDFIFLDFPNEIIEPGVTKVIDPYSKQMTRVTDDYGVATIVCKTEHGLITGQRVELANVDKFLDGVQTIIDTPTPKSFRFNVVEPVSQKDRSTRLYLDNSLANEVLTDPLILKTEITARQQVQFRRESVTYVKRFAGVVTVTLYSPHQFEVGQKVAVTFLNKKPAMFAVYNPSTKKTVNTNTLMPAGSRAMEITAVTEDTISYVDPAYVDTKYNIQLTKLDNNDLTKNYVESTESVNILRVFPKNSHGFNINDRVTVTGVDDITWEYPRYDGNFRLFEVDPGIKYSVKKFQVASKSINGVSTTVLRLHLDGNPNCVAFDVFLLDGFSDSRYLDGEYVALGPAVLESGYWVVEADTGGDVVALTTLTENPTFSINGRTWVDYLPVQSELRSNTKREPGTEFPFSFMSYTPASGKTPNRVILTTNVKHNLVVGDKVDLTFGTGGADQDIYGGKVTVTAINSMYRFSYSVSPTKKDAKGVQVKLPTAAFSQEKTGGVYRAKTSLISTASAFPEVRVRSIGTIRNGDINTAYVDAPNHGFAEGDKVSLALDHGYHRDLTNRGQPVEILKVPNENTFTYATDITKRDKKQFDIINLEYNSDYVYYTIKGYAIEVNQPEFKANVVSMVAAGKNSFAGSQNRITATLDANIYGNVREGAGAQLEFYNMPSAEVTIVNPSNITAGIFSMAYDGYYSLTITTGEPHGLDPRWDVDTTITLNSGPTFLQYPFHTSKVGGLDISSLYGKNLRVTSISSALSFTIFYADGTSSGQKYSGKPWTVQSLNTAVPVASENPRLAGLSYNAGSREITLDMSSNSPHYLSNYDIGTSFNISGFASSVSGVNNSTGATVDTSWLNGTWSVKSIPGIYSVVLSAPSGPSSSFSVYNINGATGTADTILNPSVSSINYVVSPAKRATLTWPTATKSTPTANTVVTIGVADNFADWPSETNKFGGVSISSLAGTYTPVGTLNTTGVTVAVDLGNTAFQVFGRAASSTSASLNFLNGTVGGVPVPTLTTYPRTIGANQISTTVRYNTRRIPVEGTYDLTVFNYSEGNTWSILAGLDSNTPNVVSTSSMSIDDDFNITGLTSKVPKPYLRVPPKTWLDVETGAPYIEPGSKINVSGLQGGYSVFDDLNIEVLEWTPSDFVGGIPTAIIRVRNRDYVKTVPPAVPIVLEGIPIGGSVSVVTVLPGTAYLNPATSTDRSKEITRVYRASNGTTATITSPGHGLGVGDFIYVTVYGTEYAAFSQARQKVVVTAATENTLTYELQKNTKIKSYSGMKPWEGYLVGTATDKGVNQLRFAGTGAHNICYGDQVTVSKLSDLINGSDISFISSGPSSITINSYETADYSNRTSTTGTVEVTYYAPVDAEAAGYILEAPSMSREPVVLVKTYGEYPGNASIGGITFSTNEYSSKELTNSPLPGSQLNSVADILQKYTDTIDGFDYRIDVELVETAPGVKKFNRIFTLIPIYPASLTAYLDTLPDKKLAKGQVAHPVAFGADKIVFEYPGNASNVSLAENAENAATRMFVVGNNNKSGAGIESPYSAASDIGLLADGWPLLDGKQTQEWPIKPSPYSRLDKLDNYDDETGFYNAARRFLRESKPPVGDFVISVNGSLNPVIGSYNPGDWCSVIINDDFVKTRLNSVLEPRKDVLVRKIDSIKVSVPNNPAFPEQINLQLVTDWQVDQVGE
jgi:hypothetical protein